MKRHVPIKERIWWTENDEIVQYDFKSGNIKRTNDTTETDKSGLIEDGLVQIDHEDNALLLFDEKSGDRIRITFEEFAEMSDKTDELMQISKPEDGAASLAQSIFLTAYIALTMCIMSSGRSETKAAMP